MRYAITSGVLAAKGILGECNYGLEIRKRLIPLVKSSATNRFLLNRIGDRGFKLAARYWMWDQKRKGDGLAFLRWLYSPGIFRKLLWPIVKLSMLKKKELPDGRVVTICHLGRHLREIFGSRVLQLWKLVNNGTV